MDEIEAQQGNFCRPTPPGIACAMIEREETDEIFRVATVKKFINDCCSLEHTPLTNR